MSSQLDISNALSYALSQDRELLAGTFEFDSDHDHWEWSDEVYEIHGFRRGDVVPTTQLVLAHQHPDDRDSFYQVLESALSGSEYAVSHHRVIDARDKTRYVMMLAEVVHADDDRCAGLSGVFIDMTSVRENETRLAADEAVAKSAQHRAAIEQAKGWLMATRNVDAEQAFSMLSEVSQSSNTKLWIVAKALVGDSGYSTPDETTEDQAPKAGVG